MQAIRDAKSEQLMWEGVPPTSLQPDVILGDVPIEIISPLPTIQSIPELDSDGEVEIPITLSLTEMSHTQRINHRTGYAPKFDMSSRRSSATSLRMYSTSSAELSTFHLVRSNAAAREQVDRGLQDVLSERCSSARQKASTLEEDLFEAQNVTRSFSRSRAWGRDRSKHAGWIPRADRSAARVGQGVGTRFVDDGEEGKLERVHSSMVVSMTRTFCGCSVESTRVSGTCKEEEIVLIFISSRCWISAWTPCPTKIRLFANVSTSGG